MECYLALLKIFQLIFLEVQPDLSTATKGGSVRVASDGESAASRRAPNVLFVVVVFRDDFDSFGYEVGTVETNAKLTCQELESVSRQRGSCGRFTNHGDISAGHGGLHELFCARFRDCSKVIDEVCLGHANAGIANGENAVLLVRGDADVELLLGVEFGGILQGLIADLVKGVRGIGDELSQKDFLRISKEGIFQQTAMEVPCWSRQCSQARREVG